MADQRTWTTTTEVRGREIEIDRSTLAVIGVAVAPTLIQQVAKRMR